MITQQLLSRAKTLTTLIKDGGMCSIYDTEGCQSHRCLNANCGEADGIYGETGRAADGRAVPYLTEGRLPDRDDFRLSSMLHELYASDVADFAEGEHDRKKMPNIFI